MARVVEDDGLVLDPRAGPHVGDVVEHPVGRVVVGADLAPLPVADFREEGHFGEGV